MRWGVTPEAAPCARPPHGGHKPARLVHTCLPRALTPFSASLRTRPLRAVHRLVLLLPIPLPASRHRAHGYVMPFVPPRHHSLHRMSAHDIRRALTACPVAPSSIHVTCPLDPLLPPLRLIVPRLRAPALPRSTRRAPLPVGRRIPTGGAPPRRRACLAHGFLLTTALTVAVCRVPPRSPHARFLRPALRRTPHTCPLRCP